MTSGPVVVLGATGSIGTQTLEVAAHLGLSVAALAAGRPSHQLARLAAAHPGAEVVVAALPDAGERRRFEAEVGRAVRFGPDEVAAAAAQPDRTVVNGIVGAAGLPATLAALGAGNRVALANKESLVAGGGLVAAAREAGAGVLIPVDSEHSALFQCLVGERPEDVSRLVLTASGGPFRGRSLAELAAVTPAEALVHPTWNMGPRVTVDSATLFNKGLEVIEAHHLFGMAYEDISVVVHPQSVVHSLVEMVDGSLKAQMGRPDMRLPIQYALTYPARHALPESRFSLAGLALTFEDVDRAAFPALDLAYAAGRAGGSAPAVLNAADEVAVEAFVQGRLAFTAIAGVVAEVMERLPRRLIGTVADVLAADAEARREAATVMTRLCS